MSNLDHYMQETGEQVAKSFDAYKEIAVAFWAKEQGSDHWYLFLASGAITEDTLAADYARLGQFIRGEANWSGLTSRVKLIPGASKAARRAATLAHRGRGALACMIQKVEEEVIGDLAVDVALIYPPLHATTS